MLWKTLPLRDNFAASYMQMFIHLLDSDDAVQTLICLEQLKQTDVCFQAVWLGD